MALPRRRPPRLLAVEELPAVPGDDIRDGSTGSREGHAGEIRPFAEDELEGVAAKVTKSGKNRRVPFADRVLPILLECVEGKGPDDLLFTTKTGHQLHATAVKRTIAWSSVAPNRRIHDLWHTAA